MMTVIYFLATIVLLVVIHEWGHFATARFFGIGVRSFTVGFGKQMVAWVDPKTGTSWGIAPYPLGGYVGLLGEKEAATVNVGAVNAAGASHTPAVTGKPFTAAPLHAKLAILCAGPLVNLLFAALLYAVLAYNAPPQPLPILATPPAGSVAAQAGLQAGDTVLSINNRTVTSWRDLQKALLHATVGEGVVLNMQDGKTQSLLLPPISKDQTLDDAMGLRMYSQGLQVNRLVQDSPAQQSGMKVGDVLLSVNNIKIDHPAVLLDVLKKHPGGALQIVVKRGDEQAIARVTPRLDERKLYRMGVEFAGLPTLRDTTIDAQTALLDGVSTAYTASVLTVKAFGAFLLKPFTSEQLAGPITIAQTAKASADRGWQAALAFVAGLSISVGILNLLPVPMLDGGQMVYHTLNALVCALLRTLTRLRIPFKMSASEASTQPLAQRLDRAWSTIGIVFVVFLTVLAVLTDVRRLLDVF